MKNYVADRVDQARREVGKWMATATGWFWFLEDPDPRDVNILDIAYGLARQSRYGGQFGLHINDYSVSEHSRLMDEYMAIHIPARMREDRQSMSLEDRLEVLLHDAPEHLFGDMITPVKEQFPGYRNFENMHHKAVRASFIANLAGVLVSKKEIKEIDIRIRADERERLIAEPAATLGREKLPWMDDATGLAQKLGVQIQGNLSPFEARYFLERFIEIIEQVPARMPENSPEQNSSLRRHYVDACKHVGHEPIFHPRNGKRLKLPVYVPEKSDRAKDFASKIMAQVAQFGPEAMSELQVLLANEIDRQKGVQIERASEAQELTA